MLTNCYNLKDNEACFIKAIIFTMKKIFHRIFTLNNFLTYAERVCLIGVLLPLLHFIALPFGVFRFVFLELLSGEHIINEDTKEVSFTTTQAAIDSFAWLMSFWSVALLTIPVIAMTYYLIHLLYKKNVFARIFAKGIFAMLVTSGNIERYLANNFVSAPIESAPSFKGSLYSNLGELVRSSPFDLNSYSLVSFYTRIVIIGIILVFIVYFWILSSREVKKAKNGT